MIRFYEEGKEIKRYKNIEIPDAIKELEFQDFKFDVPLSGAITFKIFFTAGILPEVWPEPRQRRTRAQMATEKAQKAATGSLDQMENGAIDGETRPGRLQSASGGRETARREIPAGTGRSSPRRHYRRRA